ncbi:MAG: hypothetical protein MUE33_05070 [Cytophagaceae bacterium]|jgi:hypothetical protein|nr:hypothetical protein [Cytophagaceae bacterium]
MKFSFLIVFFSLALYSNAQIATDTAKCYKYYDSLFTAKGVYNMTNGMHKIIMTVRYREDSSITRVCREGMIRVENNRFIAPLLIKNSKGVYEKAIKKADPNAFVKYGIPMDTIIHNGRSQTYISESGALVNLFVIDVLKK